MQARHTAAWEVFNRAATSDAIFSAQCWPVFACGNLNSHRPPGTDRKPSIRHQTFRLLPISSGLSSQSRWSCPIVYRFPTGTMLPASFCILRKLRAAHPIAPAPMLPARERDHRDSRDSGSNPYCSSTAGQLPEGPSDGPTAIPAKAARAVCGRRAGPVPMRACRNVTPARDTEAVDSLTTGTREHTTCPRRPSVSVLGGHHDQEVWFGGGFERCRSRNSAHLPLVTGLRPHRQDWIRDSLSTTRSRLAVSLRIEAGDRTVMVGSTGEEGRPSQWG